MEKIIKFFIVKHIKNLPKTEEDKNNEIIRIARKAFKIEKSKINEDLIEDLKDKTGLGSGTDPECSGQGVFNLSNNTCECNTGYGTI